jgi:SRSO17 transposase
MFKIVRFPSKLDNFFCSLTNEFLWDHFNYFRTLVLLIAFGWGKRNISSLYRHLDHETWCHRSRFNNFLHIGRWRPDEALSQKAYELIDKVKPRKKDEIYLIIDDSKKQKHGKIMDAVGWIRDPLIGRNILGHQYVKATILFRDFTIPFGIRLYVKDKHCTKLGLEFKKTTHLAAELIRSFNPPKAVKVRVLFDAYYLCPVVVSACREKGFVFISTLKSNRNLFKKGRKLKSGTYGKNLFRRQKKQKITIRKANGIASYYYLDAQWLQVGKLGKLHVVFSRKNRERGILALATDDRKLSPADIIKAYNKRWSIEMFFKDAKQLLGLGQYQNRSYRAAVTHLHLVCFAYALLTHIAIERDGEKGKRKKADRASMGNIQNELRRIVWEDTASYLKDMPDGNSVVKELSRLLMAA